MTRFYLKYKQMDIRDSARDDSDDKYLCLDVISLGDKIRILAQDMSTMVLH